jgi:hypothetical protein
MFDSSDFRTLPGTIADTPVSDRDRSMLTRPRMLYLRATDDSTWLPRKMMAALKIAVLHHRQPQSCQSQPRMVKAEYDSIVKFLTGVKFGRWQINDTLASALVMPNHQSPLSTGSAQIPVPQTVVLESLVQ